jgi:predicted ATPase
MNNYIKSIQVNLLNLLTETIDFRAGLNILSGENGTLKTKLLQTVRSGNQMTPNDPRSGVKMQAISPKRNSERRNIEAILHFIRSQNQTISSVLQQREIQDRTFEPYPSLGDLFYLLYEKLCKDGGNQREKMESVTAEFNRVIRSVFQEYELVAQWSEESGTPRISLIKRGVTEVPLQDLSLGEQEILALVANLYTSRDSYDSFLIDEPEIHLNWHLEEKLFEYFDQFCKAYDKQIIVATHSRAIFKAKYLRRTQFLYWNDEGKISVGSEISEDQRRRIAGEAIEIIKLGGFSETTFFVEDEAHREVIDSLAKALGHKVIISECGNSSNVKSLFKHSKHESGWENAVFLVDGDNEGNPFPGEDHFIHLKKYCIQNYFLDFELASLVAGKSEDEIRRAILNAIMESKYQILKKNKYFDFLIDRLTVDDIQATHLAKLDASVIFPAYLKQIGIGFSDYVRMYVERAVAKRKADAIFPEELINYLRKSDLVDLAKSTGA